MDAAPLISNYSTTTIVIVGLIVSAGILAAIVGTLYWINTRMRRSIKRSEDDWRQEQVIDSGDTLHAEGIYGTRHPEEGGRPLKQEETDRPPAGLKTSIDKTSIDPSNDRPFEQQQNRTIY